MKLWNDIKEKIKESSQTQSILLYLFFVFISALFWSFLTFNSDVQIDIPVKVELSKPESVHLLGKMPDTLTVTVSDRGYRFFTHMFRKTPTLTLRFDAYNDNNSSSFKVDQSHLRKALASILNKHAKIVSILPESININYTDQAGKKVPVKTDFVIEPALGYLQVGTISLSHDSVLIYSDAQTLKSINEVYANNVTIKDKTDTVRGKLTFPSIKGAILEPSTIDYVVPIEKLKAMSRKIKIEVINAPKDVKVLLFPSDIEVYYNSPESRAKIKDPGISLVVDYNSINLNSKTNKAEVIEAESPAVYQDLKLEYDSVEFLIQKTN